MRNWMAIRAKSLSSRMLIAGLAIASASFVFVVQPIGISESATKAAALAICAIGVWSTRVLPEHITALGFFLVAIFFSGAPIETIFSGFNSTAFWLTLGGLIIGVAINDTGLGHRLTRAISANLGAGYWRAITATALVGVALAMLMPSSMGRVVLLVPMISTLAEELGFIAGSRGRTGMILCAGFSTYMVSAGILPANLPNVILLGLSDSIYHIPITYGSYLLLHFPITGLLKVASSFIIVWMLFPDHPQPKGDKKVASPMDYKEKWLVAILSLSILLWMTDFLHHISPAWVALAAAIVCLLPQPGLVSARAPSTR